MAPHPLPALFPPGDGAHHTWPKPNYIDPETRDWGAPAGIIAMCVVTFAVVAARLWARFHLKRTGGVDDWLIIASMVSDDDCIRVLDVGLIYVTAWIAGIDDFNGSGAEGVWVPVAHLRSDAADAYHDSTGTFSWIELDGL
jgi:hypothetical protein